MTGRMPTSSLLWRSLLPPNTRLGRTIVTYLTFVGPQLPSDIAAALWVHEGICTDELRRLRQSGYLRYSPSAALHFETTGVWHPDDDEPKVRSQSVEVSLE